MAPKKLSEAEKQEIIQLYYQPEESTSTLASRFGVSSSTISRALKQGLPEDDYNSLVQQKRAGAPPTVTLSGEPPAVEPPPHTPSKETEPSATGELPRRRRRSSAASQSEMHEVMQLPITDFDQVSGDRPYVDPVEITASPLTEFTTDKESDEDDEEEAAYSPSFDDETDTFDEDLEDELDTDDDFTDIDDEEDFEDEDEDEDIPLAPLHLQNQEAVQIYPFADAELPRTCYLVIDRSAELITRPLEDFAELGHLPSAELSENTLPVFDNHRVAKRFANRRTQRIVKIPDSRILQKTMPYLQAKGITRLLLDGQVYSLVE